MKCESITLPSVKDEGHHSESFNEFVCFIRGGSTNLHNFGEDVEILLTKEGAGTYHRCYGVISSIFDCFIVTAAEMRS
jgi:hypothetical protein